MSCSNALTTFFRRYWQVFFQLGSDKTSPVAPQQRQIAYPPSVKYCQSLMFMVGLRNMFSLEVVPPVPTASLPRVVSFHLPTTAFDMVIVFFQSYYYIYILLSIIWFQMFCTGNTKLTPASQARMQLWSWAYSTFHFPAGTCQHKTALLFILLIWPWIILQRLAAQFRVDMYVFRQVHNISCLK